MVIEDFWVLARFDGEAVNFQKKMANNFTKMAKNQFFFEVTPIFFTFSQYSFAKTDFLSLNLFQQLTSQCYLRF